jgi:hypothetical protein
MTTAAGSSRFTTQLATQAARQAGNPVLVDTPTLYDRGPIRAGLVFVLLHAIAASTNFAMGEMFRCETKLVDCSLAWAGR